MPNRLRQYVFEDHFPVYLINDHERKNRIVDIIILRKPRTAEKLKLCRLSPVRRDQELSLLNR